MDDLGLLHTDHDAVDDIVIQYFLNLFMATQDIDMDPVLACVEPRVFETMNEKLCSPYSMPKVEAVLKHMHPHKALGSNGMNPIFFQKFWHVVGCDVFNAVLAILNDHPIPPLLKSYFCGVGP